ncbi:MAG: S-formylglutathione hydrolase [Rhodanobacteraceae bacterium]
MHVLSEQRCFGGTQGFYEHESEACAGPMRFGVFMPPATMRPSDSGFPMLYYLAGLTCTHETFAIKAGAQRVAAELGLMLVTPDTSPRDSGIEGATGDWEFGEGAGFYLDATTPAFAARFRMSSYVVDELPHVIGKHFESADISSAALCGHSMGGHGALTIALKNPDRYKSVSAFAPIVAPCRVPWGEKAFSRYLGDNRDDWKSHDACELLNHATFPGTILVDQGDADPFLDVQLQPHRLAAACRETGQKLNLRLHPGYDHSYWFVQSFVEDHLRHHAEALRA